MAHNFLLLLVQKKFILFLVVVSRLFLRVIKKIVCLVSAVDETTCKLTVQP
jgi:hypothetical protein